MSKPLPRVTSWPRRHARKHGRLRRDVVFVLSERDVPLLHAEDGRVLSTMLARVAGFGVSSAQYDAWLWAYCRQAAEQAR